MTGDLFKRIEARKVRRTFEFDGEQQAESGIFSAASQTERLETVATIDSKYANAIR